jgi:hypothetical protein
VVSDALALPSAVIEAVGSVAATLDFRIAAAAQEGEASISAPVDDVTVDANHRVAAATSDGAVGLYELSSPLPTSVVRLRMFPVARPFVALSTRHHAAHDGT